MPPLISAYDLSPVTVPHHHLNAIDNVNTLYPSISHIQCYSHTRIPETIYYTLRDGCSAHPNTQIHTQIPGEAVFDM